LVGGPRVAWLVYGLSTPSSVPNYTRGCQRGAAGIRLSTMARASDSCGDKRGHQTPPGREHHTHPETISNRAVRVARLSTKQGSGSAFAGIGLRISYSEAPADPQHLIARHIKPPRCGQQPANAAAMAWRPGRLASRPASLIPHNSQLAPASGTTTRASATSNPLLSVSQIGRRGSCAMSTTPRGSRPRRRPIVPPSRSWAPCRCRSPAGPGATAPRRRARRRRIR